MTQQEQTQAIPEGVVLEAQIAIALKMADVGSEQNARVYAQAALSAIPLMDMVEALESADRAFYKISNKDVESVKIALMERGNIAKVLLEFGIMQDGFIRKEVK